MLLPFQGALSCGVITRGVAPGNELIGPSGRIVCNNYHKQLAYYVVKRAYPSLVGRRADIKWPLHLAGGLYNEMRRTVL